MLHHIENSKSILTTIGNIVIKRLEDAQNSENPENALSMSDIKKCMDITRDIADTAIKLAKNEEMINEHTESECVLPEKKKQDIYAILQELKIQFTTKVLKDIVEMNEEEAMEIISQVVEKMENESECKLKRRDFKTKAEYKRAKAIQKIVVKRSAEEVEKSRLEYCAFFEKLAGVPSRLAGGVPPTSKEVCKDDDKTSNKSEVPSFYS